MQYMITAKRSKSERGRYDGCALPPGLVLERGAPKDTRKPVVCEPWQKVMLWVFDRGEELRYNANAVIHEISQIPYLFPEISEEDKVRYEFKTFLTHCPNGGYKPRHAGIVRSWWGNITLAGGWPTGNGSSNSGRVLVIMDNHPAVVDITRFKRAYEFCTGQALEAEEITAHPQKQFMQSQTDSPY